MDMAIIATDAIERRYEAIIRGGASARRMKIAAKDRDVTPMVMAEYKVEGLGNIQPDFLTLIEDTNYESTVKFIITYHAQYIPEFAFS